MTGDCDLQYDIEKLTECWVFGYGSILWNPGFSYVSRHTGYVEGYARRFWQGSTTHRGTPQSPGRVATLIQRKGDRVWGAAFHVVGTSMIEACLRHLGVRECHLGGYEVIPVTFVSAETGSRASLTVNDNMTHQSASPCDENSKLTNNNGCRQAWAFIATPNNSYYLGHASVDEVAIQIVNSSGTSGPNSEYVTRLADYIRTNIPQDTDAHLFQLDSKIRQLMANSRCHSSSLDVNDAEICRPNNVTMSGPPTASTTVQLADLTSSASKGFGENEGRHENSELTTSNLREPLNFGMPGMSTLAINIPVVSVRAC